MPSLHLDAKVRLKEDDPIHALHRGSMGIVVSVWLSSHGFLCEVEFTNPTKSSPAIRTLLRAQQLEVIE